MLRGECIQPHTHLTKEPSFNQPLVRLKFLRIYFGCGSFSEPGSRCCFSGAALNCISLCLWSHASRSEQSSPFYLASCAEGGRMGRNALTPHQAGSCVLGYERHLLSQVLATLPKLGHPRVLFLAGREQQPQTNSMLRASRQPPVPPSGSRLGEITVDRFSCRVKALSERSYLCGPLTRGH